MKRTCLFIVAALTLLLAGCDLPAATENAAPAVYPGEQWESVTRLEDAGWSSEKLARAQAYSQQIGSAAVMIVDDGLVVDAWGDLSKPYQCHSMRKSLLSALIGIHVEEGDLDLSSTMEELGIEDTEPSLTAEEKQATVRDLIRARSGIYHPALGEAPSMKAQRPERHSHAPGSFWYYNNWDFNALGTIFEQETGAKIFEEFQRRIAEPLQMEDFRVSDCRYGTALDEGSPGLSVHSYYGFRMSTRDLARFGLLFLRQGHWRGHQIVPADWVQESTTTHSEFESGGGYGYMWWTGEGGGLFPNVEVKGHSYYASGYRGHRIIVLPYHHLVIVHRVDTDLNGTNVNSTAIGTLLWLILDAAGEAGIGPPPHIDAAPGVRLSGDELHAVLAERSLRVFDRRDVLLAYSGNGSFSVSEDGILIETGTWWVEGEEYCHELSAGLGGAWCGLVVLDGDSVGLFESEGTVFARLGFVED